MYNWLKQQEAEMGISNSVEDALDRAAQEEVKMVALPEGEDRDKARRMCNLLFKRAMKNDGNVDFAENII
jgi:hypothetical protein